MVASSCLSKFRLLTFVFVLGLLACFRLVSQHTQQPHHQLSQRSKEPHWRRINQSSQRYKEPHWRRGRNSSGTSYVSDLASELGPISDTTCSSSGGRKSGVPGSLPHTLCNSPVRSIFCTGGFKPPVRPVSSSARTGGSESPVYSVVLNRTGGMTTTGSLDS